MSTTERVIELLAQQLEVSADTIGPGTNIVEDLGADSLDIVEFLMMTEEEFGIIITTADVSNLYTVSQVADFIESLM